ncbi:MAG TPA: hypothetical protein VLE53_04575 [Gemmatimonadaceae bacterium]|nr:hypothetical protein [Gemmatimonadaceae bacterium]
MPRLFYLVGWGYVAICAALLARRAPTTSHAIATADPAGAAAEWFRRVRPYCNAVEIATLQRQTRPPEGTQGSGYHAACFALAGRIDDARRVIDGLPEPERHRAAGIVFDVGHPVADAGDDRSAGPIMELVIDYWPNHYMALYHAGMAEYMLGQYPLATRNLEVFLREYSPQDGWRRNALEVLGRMRDSSGQVELRRPGHP